MSGLRVYHIVKTVKIREKKKKFSIQSLTVTRVSETEKPAKDTTAKKWPKKLEARRSDQLPMFSLNLSNLKFKNSKKPFK